MNYYETLQISPDASEEVIKAAYKALVKKYHPDNGVVNGTEKLQKINEAYKILSDSSSRRKYDQLLKNSKEKIVNDEKQCEYSTDDFYNSKQGESSDEVNDDYEEKVSESKFGNIFDSVVDGISKRVYRNRQIFENAYYDGLNMDDYELVNAFKKNYGLKRQGYSRALEEREFLVRDCDGNLKPTEKFWIYGR